MTNEALEYEVSGAVAILTLNRPAAYNALNQALGRALLEAAIEADENRAVRCIVVTGAGKAFCAGGDVKDFHDQAGRVPVYIKRLTTDFHGAISRLARTPKPVLMAVNGVAAGAGMSLALAGDLVVAAASARFSLAYSRIGAAPDGSSTWFLPRLVGYRRAIELYLTSRDLSAQEALAWGLVNRVLPDPEFQSGIASLARELAEGPTVAIGHAKQLFRQSLQEGLESQMELEAQAIAATAHTEDFRAGVGAFVKKLARADFRGR